MTALDIIEDKKAVPIDRDGNHDRFKHYVRKDDIVKATFDGEAVKAICGKVWVANKNPEPFPLCADCEKIWKEMRAW